MLAAALALSMAGCGGGEEPEAEKEPETEATAQPEERSTDWKPDGEVTLVVPYEAGSLADITARVLAQYLERYIDQTVSIENIPGGCPLAAEEDEEASSEEDGEDGEDGGEYAEEGEGEEVPCAGAGTLGWSELAKRDGDGLTLGYIQIPDFTNAVVRWPEVCSLDDFTPICTQTTETAVIVVRKGDERFASLEELVDFGRANPGALIAATDGEFGAAHSWTQLFATDANIEYTPNHQTSANEELRCLRSGSADFCVARVDDIIGRDEELLVLGVFSPERLSQYPDVPTLKEQGYYGKWQGCAYCVVAPADVPEDVVIYYEQAFRDTMADARYQSASTGVITEFKTAAETAELISQQRGFALRAAGTLW